MTTSLPHSTVNPESMPVKKKRRSFGEMLRHNWQQKLGALVGALVLFVAVSMDRNLSVSFEKIPVAFDLPEGYVTVDGKTEATVDVKVYGRSSLLRGVKRDDIGVIKVSPPAREGNVQITLQDSMISLPDGVRIEKFSPEFIGLNLEGMESRTVAVSTDHAFTGDLLPGYQLGEVRIEPAEIEIYGPKSAIAQISQLYIEPIDLTGKASTFTVNRWVVRNRSGVSAKSEQVSVTVNILSKSSQHVLLGVPITPLNLSLRYEFVPATIDLTLVGDEAALAKVDSSKLFVTFDASEDEKLGTHVRQLDATDISVSNLPAGVGFDKEKLPSVLLKVWKDDPAKPKAVPAIPMMSVAQ